MTTFVNPGLLEGSTSEAGSPPRSVTRLAELANDREKCGSEEIEAAESDMDALVPFNVEVSLESLEEEGTGHQEAEVLQEATLPPPMSRVERRSQNRAVSFSDQNNYTESHSQHSNNNFTFNTEVPPTSQPQRRRPERVSASSFASSYNTLTASIASQRSPGPCTCLTWTRRRLQVAALGCTSAACVLTIRLYLDISQSGELSSTYIIHSVIILLDMVLIHLFTYSPWLSAGGECITILCFTLFHFTHETIFELAETTFIAILCSIHMIVSRNKHMDHEEQLAVSLWHAASELENIHVASRVTHSHTSQQLPFLLGENSMTPETDPAVNGALLQQHDIEEETVESNSTIVKIIIDSHNGYHQQRHQQYNHTEEEEMQQETVGHDKNDCWHHFFEHFLDGSAGVMYTSFVGLILDELVSYNW